jgi:hypothetical protein
MELAANIPQRPAPQNSLSQHIVIFLSPGLGMTRHQQVAPNSALYYPGKNPFGIGGNPSGVVGALFNLPPARIAS